MDSHYTYMLILALSIAGPLALSFDKKVAFYRNYLALAVAILLPAVVYTAWDAYFTSEGIWRFNRHYTLGIVLGNLPLEEVLFFVVVPYCCVFIYECIRCYLPGLRSNVSARYFIEFLAAALLVTGLFFHQRRYTYWTFTCFAVFVSVLRVFSFYFKTFPFNYFLAAFVVVLAPFLIVNGFLTALPVVEYNNAENLQLRLYTIPVEDIVYGMLLMMMNVAVFEKMRGFGGKRISGNKLRQT